MPECNGQEGFRDRRSEECETLCHAQAKNWRNCVKPSKERKTPRNLVPLDLSIALRSEGATVQLCGNSQVAEQWTNGHYSMRKGCKEKCGGNHWTLYSWWMRKVARTVGKIDDYVKHIFRRQIIWQI